MCFLHLIPWSPHKELLLLENTDDVNVSQTTTQKHYCCWIYETTPAINKTISCQPWMLLCQVHTSSKPWQIWYFQWGNLNSPLKLQLLPLCIWILAKSPSSHTEIVIFVIYCKQPIQQTEDKIWSPLNLCTTLYSAGKHSKLFRQIHPPPNSLVYSNDTVSFGNKQRFSN